MTSAEEKTSKSSLDDSNMQTDSNSSSKDASSILLEEGSEDLQDSASLIQCISNYFNNETFSDVSLKVGQKVFKAHKFILAKSSRVFQTMLYSDSWNCHGDESVKVIKNSLLELEESLECSQVFDKFLQFLYSGKIKICSNSAVGILCLADKYEVDCLKNLTVQYMIRWSMSPKIHNALAWYYWAKLLGFENLLSRCFHTIAWNFSEVLKSEDWIKMDIGFLMDFLCSSKLVVKNEFLLYEAVIDWLMSEQNLPNIGKNHHILLSLIRFSQFQVSQLCTIEGSPLSTEGPCSKLIQNLVAKAYRFRAVFASQMKSMPDFSDDFYKPRDYLDLIVDTVRIQNPIRFGFVTDVKASRSAVPSDSRDADWKISYRTQGDLWLLQMYCHDPSISNNELKVEFSLLICNEKDHVLKVERDEPKRVTRGSVLTLQTSLGLGEQAQTISLLIKPIA